MADRPLVSLIIPNYNKGRWLAETLFSAFGQTYNPLEVVIYDDGSTDQSVSIIKAFAGAQNFKYKLGTECSGNVAISRNRAIEISSGEYVAFLDSDDLLLPFHVEDLMAEAIKDPKIDFLFGNVTIIDENRNKIAGPWIPDERTIFDTCSVGLVVSIIKKSVLTDLGGFDESMLFSEDWDLIIRLFKKNVIRKYVNTSQYLGRRVFDETSVSKDSGTFNPNFFSSKRFESHLYLRKKHSLSGPCRCGCGVVSVEPVTITEDMLRPSGGQKISASMIVRDEESVLGPCLESIKGIDEIVILDTGSTDNTPAVARQHTDKYFQGEYAWNDNFAEARNESLKRCTGDWILIIDADEHLEEGGVQKIRDLIATIPGNINGIGFRTISDRGALKHESVRLFRNGVGTVWHGAVHNYLSVRAQHSSDITLYYGYSPAHEKDPDRSLRILKKEVEKDPSCLRERFYLAREFFYRKQWETAIEHYRIYLEKAHWAPEKAEAWMQVSRCYGNLSMIFEARLACLRAIEVNVDFKDALLMMGALSQDQEAKKKWEEYATLSKNTNTLFCSLA